jgi:hypothetical protein
LRLADFFGFNGFMSEIFRIISSKRDVCFCGFVFNDLKIAKVVEKFKPHTSVLRKQDKDNCRDF